MLRVDRVLRQGFQYLSFYLITYCNFLVLSKFSTSSYKTVLILVCNTVDSVSNQKNVTMKKNKLNTSSITPTTDQERRLCYARFGHSCPVSMFFMGFFKFPFRVWWIGLLIEIKKHEILCTNLKEINISYKKNYARNIKRNVKLKFLLRNTVAWDLLLKKLKQSTISFIKIWLKYKKSSSARWPRFCFS